jgi:hypothetical protein
MFRAETRLKSRRSETEPLRARHDDSVVLTQASLHEFDLHRKRPRP